MSISLETRLELLRITRSSVAGKLGEKTRRAEPSGDADPVLHEARGAFVTLRQHNALRGCIGQIEVVRPLWETVARMAQNAAFEDPRFRPVTLDELDTISFEASILSPIERLCDPGSIVVGTHGLIVEREHNKGLLLPQVPVEQGWTQTEFLDQTCLKAGLPRDAWKSPSTSLFVFSAEVFSEG